MPLKKGYKQLVAEAERVINALTPTQVNALNGHEDVLLIDLRDIREVQREGKIPGARHIPRGMLEFWIDPDSPYYKDYFDSAGQIIFYCNLGLRSALATKTAQDMGVENLSHMSGGFTRWAEEIGQIEKVAKK